MGRNIKESLLKKRKMMTFQKGLLEWKHTGMLIRSQLEPPKEKKLRTWERGNTKALRVVGRIRDPGHRQIDSS